MQRRVAHPVHEIHDGSGAAAQIFQTTYQRQEIRLLRRDDGGSGKGDGLHPPLDRHILAQPLHRRLKKVRVDVEQPRKERPPRGVDHTRRRVHRCYFGGRAERDDAVAAHRQRTVVDDAALVVLGDDQGMANEKINCRLHRGYPGVFA